MASTSSSRSPHDGSFGMEKTVETVVGLHPAALASVRAGLATQRDGGGRATRQPGRGAHHWGDRDEAICSSDLRAPRLFAQADPFTTARQSGSSDLEKRRRTRTPRGRPGTRAGCVPALPADQSDHGVQSCPVFVCRTPGAPTLVASTQAQKGTRMNSDLRTSTIVRLVSALTMLAATLTVASTAPASAGTDGQHQPDVCRLAPEVPAQNAGRRRGMAAPLLTVIRARGDRPRRDLPGRSPAPGVTSPQE